MYRPDVPYYQMWRRDCIIPADADADADAVLCVVTPSAGRSKRITPLKLYRVRASDNSSFEIVDDNNEATYCLWCGCAHLNSGFSGSGDVNWKRVYIPQADLPEHLR